MTDYEALLRGVPTLKIHVHCRDGCWVGDEGTEIEYPDYPALAQAVRTAVEKELKDERDNNALLTPYVRAQATARIEAENERDALRAALATAERDAGARNQAVARLRAALTAIRHRALQDTPDDVQSEVASGRTINDMYGLAKAALAPPATETKET